MSEVMVSLWDFKKSRHFFGKWKNFQSTFSLFLKNNNLWLQLNCISFANFDVQRSAFNEQNNPLKAVRSIQILSSTSLRQFEMQQNNVTFVFFQEREPDLKGDRNCVALLVSRKQRTFSVCGEAQTLKWSVLFLFLLFWGGPVQSLKRTKNWTRPVHFQTIMPSSLGIYTRATTVTLLVDLAESWNLFPEGIQQSASTSGAYLG